jgi:hypothetical protein
MHMYGIQGSNFILESCNETAAEITNLWLSGERLRVISRSKSLTEKLGIGTNQVTFSLIKMFGHKTEREREKKTNREHFTKAL